MLDVSEAAFETAASDLARKLDALVGYLQRYVTFGPAEAVAVALWVAPTHALEAAEATPYLEVTPAEKSSGRREHWRRSSSSSRGRG